MLNYHKIQASKNYSMMSKFLLILLGSSVYGSAICLDLPGKNWNQVAFGLAFFCFVGAFMTGESERFADEVLSEDEDMEAQARLDSAFENSRPKKLRHLKTVEIPSDRDFPTIPFTWG